MAAVALAAVAAAGAEEPPLPPAAELPKEAIEMELIRAVHTGRTFSYSVEQIEKFTLGKGVEFESYVIGRTALAVLGKDEIAPEYPLAKLLDQVLGDYLVRPEETSFSAKLPPRFMNYTLVFHLVYAMVVTGDKNPAIATLKKHLSGGSEFKKNVSLHALRLIGGEKTSDLISEYGSKEKDSYNILLNNLLGETFVPFFSEIPDRIETLKPADRTAVNLINVLKGKRVSRSFWESVQTKFNGSEASPPAAAYLLGFFPNGGPEEKEELEALRSAATSGEFYTRHLALQSLGIRSKETIPYWIERYNSEQSEWTQALIVRIGFINFGKEFIPAAIQLLQRSPHQYIQWELMWGILNQYRGIGKRTIWDLWYPTTLQAHIDWVRADEKEQRIPPQETKQLISWLQETKWSGEPGVMHQLLYNLALSAGAEDVKPLLAVYDARPDKVQLMWILPFLKYPEVLTYLRAWNEKETDPFAKEQLKASITVIGQNYNNDGDAVPASPGGCCDPTEACLRQKYAAAVPPADLQSWITDMEAGSKLQIEFTDSIKREAVVIDRQHRSKWVHIYGCWNQEL